MRKLEELNAIGLLAYCYYHLNKEQKEQLIIKDVLMNVERDTTHCSNCPLFIKDDRYTNRGGTCILNEAHANCERLLEKYISDRELDKGKITVNLLRAFSLDLVELGTKDKPHDFTELQKKLVETADTLVEEEVNYSVFQQLVDELKHQYWDNFDEKDFIEYCKNYKGRSEDERDTL